MLWQALCVPECQQCDRYLTPTSLEDDGTCPFCDSDVVVAEKPLPVQRALPWHFKLMVALAALYLIWRVIDLVAQLF